MIYSHIQIMIYSIFNVNHTRIRVAPIFRAVLSVIFLWVGSVTTAQTQLVMVEETGCMWCARWNAEVGPEYALTAEGMAAPLRRIDIRDPVPSDLTVVSDFVLTPTFVLVVDGQEMARLEGYPGEDFFWGLLGQMLTTHTDWLPVPADIAG